MRGLITDALQGEVTHIAQINLRLSALASRMTATMPGVSISLTWDASHSDVRYRFTGFGHWLQKRHDDDILNLAAAAVSRLMTATGLSRSTITDMASKADFETMETGDFHILAAVCEDHFEDIIEARLGDLHPDQKMLAAHAAEIGVSAPLEFGGTMPLDHLMIDRDLLAVWMEDRPALSIVRDIRASMMEELSDFPWHGAIDPVRIAMTDGIPTLTRTAQISASPVTHFDGLSLMVEQDLPETLLEAIGSVEGRTIGEVVETGYAGIDSRRIISVQETTLGFEMHFGQQPLRIGDDQEMARALERELRDERPEE